MIFQPWLSLAPEQIPANLPLSEKIDGYIRPGAKVLDIGCGYGRLSDFFVSRGCRYYGIDVNSSAIEAARRNAVAKREFHRNYSEFLVGDVEKTYFPPRFFDVLVAQGTLACMDLDGRTRANAEMKRICKEGSILHITELDLLSDEAFYRAQQQKTGEYGTVTMRLDGSGFGYTTHHFSRRELVELLGCGWEILLEEHPVLTTKNGNQYPSHRLIMRKGRSGG